MADEIENTEVNTVMKDAALVYLERGFSVIPIEWRKEGKSPLVTWSKWAEEKPSIAQVEAWWTAFPKAGIGIITGEVSGLIVLDVNKELTRLSLDLPDTGMSSATPSGGWHLYYNYVEGPQNSSPNGFSIRSNGGYVIAPPTPKYVWTSEGDPGTVTAEEIASAMEGLSNVSK